MAILNPKLLEAIDGLGDTPTRQSPLMHLITSPYYYDFEADLEFDVDLKGVKAHEQGRVIYEQMLFHSFDYPFYYFDIRANADTRVAHYFLKK